MIDWIIGFLVAKWWVDKTEKLDGVQIKGLKWECEVPIAFPTGKYIVQISVYEHLALGNRLGKPTRKRL